METKDKKIIIKKIQRKKSNNDNNPPQYLKFSKMTYEQIQNETKNHIESIKKEYVENKCSKCPRKFIYNILMDNIPSYEMYCEKCNSYYKLCSKCYNKHWIKCPSCKKEMQDLSYVDQKTEYDIK